MYTPRHSQRVSPRTRLLAIAVPAGLLSGIVAGSIVMRQPVSERVLGTADGLTAGAEASSLTLGWLVVSLPLIAAVAVLFRPAALEFFLLRWVTKLTLAAGIAIVVALASTTLSGGLFLDGVRYALAAALAVTIVLGTPVAVSMLGSPRYFRDRLDRLRRVAVGSAALISMSALGVAGLAL